jgi:hypothetical protein
MTSDNPEPGERHGAFDRILAPVKKLLFRKKSSLPFSLRDYENLDLPRQEPGIS